jgi:Flp pilus assembly pilin Flp
MGALLRRLRSCETGSALTEYSLIIAVLALGLVAALGVFRNSVGTMTNRTSGTISGQSGRYGSGGPGSGGFGSGGYGSGGGAGGGTVTQVDPEPTEPDPGAGDSTAVATTSGVPAGRRR